MAVSPQTRDKSAATIAQRKLAFDILDDRNNHLADQMGLSQQLPDDLKAIYLEFGIDLDASNQESSWKLPMPARYVIDTEGVIRYAQVHADYTRRPEPEETLEAVRQLLSS